MRFPQYLLGSVLAILPHLFTYPIMGMKIREIKSPEFLIALAVEALYLAVTAAAYAIYRKKRKTA